MESRREPRFNVNQAVEVTDLERRTLFEGRLANLSGGGARLLVAHELRRGSLVKVVWEKNLLLGEVIYCSPEGGDFAVGIQLEDTLFDYGALFSAHEHEKDAEPTEG